MVRDFRNYSKNGRFSIGNFNMTASNLMKIRKNSEINSFDSEKVLHEVAEEIVTLVELGKTEASDL